MKKICFATGNKHKLQEIRELLSHKFEIVSPADLGFHDEIEETGKTLPANAELKARTISEALSVDCFADDTGLEVEVLGGAPGVYSARYAGENVTYQDNVLKLLRELTGQENRTARFVTSICLMMNGQPLFFEGEVEGTITEAQHGEKGFGYDPIFLPNGFKETFAEMSAAQKNAISHRGRAIQKLAQYLETL